MKELASEGEAKLEGARLVYFIMMLLGAGVLLPWNCLLNALDWLSSKFPHADLGYRVTPAYVYIQPVFVLVMVKVCCMCAGLRGGGFPSRGVVPSDCRGVPWSVGQPRILHHANSLDARANGGHSRPDRHLLACQPVDDLE
jgi:hypothetical protein